MGLKPSYGRDYKSEAEVMKDWLAGKDFTIADVSSPWNGKYTSIRDAQVGERISIRYAKLRKQVCFIHVPDDSTE